MAVKTTPPSIELLHIVAVLLDRFSDGLSPGTIEGERVKMLLRDPSPDSNAGFFQSPNAIGLFQVVMLATLTLYEGVSVPSLRDISLQDNQVTVRWDGGSSDTFGVGIYDPRLLRCAHYIGRRILGITTSPRSQLPVRFFEIAALRLAYYKSALEVCERRLLELRQNKVAESLSGNVDPIFLFVLMGVLPSDQLSALFSFVQQFLPSDLSVTDANGKRYIIATLFQSSADVKFLIEQVAGYLELYTSPKMPIIREITRSKTLVFMETMMQKPATAAAVFANIDSIIANQIRSRVGIYGLLMQFLDGLTK